MERPSLYHEAHGSGGPFLLLVHGMLSSRAQWLPNLAALSAVCRPVVVELLGHGRSPTPDDPALYTPAHYVAEFERIRLALGTERWFVCGQSLGAALTLRYALDDPDHVIAQVFTNSNSALAGDEWVERVRPVIEAQARRLETEGRSLLDRRPLNPGRSHRLSPEARAALTTDYALHTPRGIAYTGLYTVPDSSVRSRLGENRVPTLLVVGEREERFREHRLFAERTMPMLEVVGLDAGHAVNLETPEEFNRAVTAFLGRWTALA
ncbi:MAG: alpha/beta hydrolase [Dehalococcoidia bacterium]|nr:alpha/beta hydrolase [Dehalococcoidia bacterium]